MMTTLSVLHFNQSNILQQTTNNNTNTLNNDRREIIILRKPPHILPQPCKDYNVKEDNNINNILLTNTSDKNKKAASKHHHQTTIKDAKTGPQPLAVARRNARERNRVKQVNNGYANLRQHIPSFIASTFESGSGRNGNKKLSKVETLRMAVEYIRSLEDLLEATDSDNINNELGNISNSSNNYHTYHHVMSPSADEDELSTNPTPPPQPSTQHNQYIRINTSTNTYEIIHQQNHHHHHLYEDSENLAPLNVDEHILSDPSLIMDADMDFSSAQDLSLLNSESLSPGAYSEEQSLSPSSTFERDQKCFIPVVFNNNALNNDDNNELIKLKLGQIKSEDMTQDLPVISLKSDHELSVQQHTNVIDVMQWWDEQQQPHQQTTTS